MVERVYRIPKTDRTDFAQTPRSPHQRHCFWSCHSTESAGRSATSPAIISSTRTTTASHSNSAPKTPATANASLPPASSAAMAHIGHKRGEFFVQHTSMTHSIDLVHWEKYAQNPTGESTPRYWAIISTSQRIPTHWRDSFLFDNDYYYQCVSTRHNEGDKTERGSIGLSCSTDMLHWEILPPTEYDRISAIPPPISLFKIHGTGEIMPELSHADYTPDNG